MEDDDDSGLVVVVVVVLVVCAEVAGIDVGMMTETDLTVFLRICLFLFRFVGRVVEATTGVVQRGIGRSRSERFNEERQTAGDARDVGDIGDGRRLSSHWRLQSLSYMMGLEGPSLIKTTTRKSRQPGGKARVRESQLWILWILWSSLDGDVLGERRRGADVACWRCRPREAVYDTGCLSLNPSMILGRERVREYQTLI